MSLSMLPLPGSEPSGLTAEGDTLLEPPTGLSNAGASIVPLDC
jgi:hypothetical protein